MEPLSNNDIDQALKSLNGWKRGDDEIMKEFSFDNFKEALGFIVRVGLEAEALQHHPQLFNVYNTVNITLNTHDAGDKVTQKDIDLATQIESI